MQTYTLHSVVEIADVHQLAVQEAVVSPAQLLGALLVNQQPRTKLLVLYIEETSKLVQIHGRVQAEVGLEGRAPHIRLHLVHEDGQVVLDGVDVGRRVVEIWGHGGDELGARRPEELLEDGERVRTALLELQQLIAVLLTQSRVDGVIQPRGVKGDADGNQCVHLLVLLGDGVVLRALLEVLGPRDVDQNVAEHADGVAVATHHHVGETHIVVGCEVGGHDTGKHGLLVELDIVERLERKTEVSEKTVDPEEANDGEISEHAIQALGAVVARNGHGVLVTLHGSQLLGNLRPLNQGVEHIKHAVAPPCVWVLAEQLNFFLIIPLPRNSGAVRGERIELIDELVDNIPGPVVLCEGMLVQTAGHLVRRSRDHYVDVRMGAPDRPDPRS